MIGKAMDEAKFDLALRVSPIHLESERQGRLSLVTHLVTHCQEPTHCPRGGGKKESLMFVGIFVLILQFQGRPIPNLLAKHPGVGKNPSTCS